MSGECVAYCASSMRNGVKMVCSFCKENGHRSNKCPEKFRDFDENDLFTKKKYSIKIKKE
jgi:hypothetical protein